MSKSLKPFDYSKSYNKLISSTSQKDKFHSFFEICSNLVSEWSYETTVEEEVTTDWLYLVLYEEPQATVREFRSWEEKLDRLIALLQTKNSIDESAIKKIDPKAIEALSVIKSEEFQQRSFKKMFTYKCDTPDLLFTYCLVAFNYCWQEFSPKGNSISRKVIKLHQCAVCSKLFNKNKRQNYCGISCRTIANNSKRDKYKRNKSEKENYKKRLIHKNSVYRKNKAPVSPNPLI